MTKTDMGTAGTAQPADDIAWRHFWLAHVIVEADGRRPVHTAQPALRTGKESPSRRLRRLHHMRATLGPPRQ